MTHSYYIVELRSRPIGSAPHAWPLSHLSFSLWHLISSRWLFQCPFLICVALQRVLQQSSKRLRKVRGTEIRVTTSPQAFDSQSLRFFQTHITFFLPTLSLHRPYVPLKILSAPKRLSLTIFSWRWSLTLQADKFLKLENISIFSIVPFKHEIIANQYFWLGG